MAKIYYSVLLLFLFGRTSWTQNDSLSFASFKRLDMITDTKKSYKNFSDHISAGALNLYFNKQISSQLSGKEDLTMNKSYAILNDADGTLTFGGSFAKRSKKSEFIPYLFQTGVKVKSEDSFGEIFNSSGGFSGSAGIFVKSTWLSRGRLTFGYGNDQIEGEKSEIKIKSIQNYEAYLSNKYEKELKKEIDEIQQDINDYATQFGLSQKEKDDFYDKKVKDLKDEKRQKYYKEVVEYLTEKELFVGSHKAWFSVDLFIAVTPTEFVTAQSFTSTSLDTIALRPHTLSLNYNYLYTRSNGMILFLSFGPGAKWQNTITANGLKAKSFSNFVERDDMNTDIELTEVQRNSVYVGDIKRHIITTSINSKVTLMWGGDFDFMGLSAGAEYQSNPNGNIWFWKWGVPFNLKGEDDETKVNIEPQARWDTKNRDLIIGLSVGLPFGTKLY